MKRMRLFGILAVLLVLAVGVVPAAAHHNTIWQNASCSSYDFGARYYGGSELRRVVWNVTANVDGTPEVISDSWEGRSSGFLIFQRTGTGAHDVNVTGWVKMYERDWSFFGGWHWDLIETDTFNLHFNDSRCHDYGAYITDDQKCDEGWWRSAIITDFGTPIDNFVIGSGAWTNPFVTETVPAADYDILLPDGSSVTRHAEAIAEDTECQVPHRTDYWFENKCDIYSAGYMLDGVRSEPTVTGSWTNPYEPESVEVTVYIPANVDEQYPNGTSFTFTIAKDVSCIDCKVTNVYPMTVYELANVPANVIYWQGPFGRGPGICPVIHVDGEVPWSLRVSELCSLCPSETLPEGFLYDVRDGNGNAFGQNEWVTKVECYGKETHYYFMGYLWDEWVRLGEFSNTGERLCNRIEGCADWAEEQYGVVP